MATKLSPVGNQFRVNLVTNFSQQAPDIAPLSDGRFVVVYENFTNGTGTDNDILGQFVNANGTLSGTTLFPMLANGLQSDPAVAARGDGSFTTVWQDFGTTTGSPIADPDIYYAITGAAGNGIANRTLIMNASGRALQRPDIATLASTPAESAQMVVAELAYSATDHDIVFDILGPAGQRFAGALFDNVDASAGLQQNPQVAGSSDRALVVYEDNRGESNAGEFHISARVFDATFPSFGPILTIADAAAGFSYLRPDVAFIGDGRFVIVYDYWLAVVARIYDAYTGALGPEINVSTAPAEFAYAAKVAATQDGGFVVTWQDENGLDGDTSGQSIHARRFDPYGNPFGDDFLVNTLTDGDQVTPVVGITGGNIVTAWTDFASRPGDTSAPSVQARAFSAPGFDYDSAAYADFDNNGRSDLLYQNLSTGAVAIWTTDSAGVAVATAAPGSLPSGYKIDGTGNFNSAPGDDILLRGSGGQIAVWVTSGTSVVDFKVLGSAPAAYLNAGNGDLTGDGQSDLLFRHVGTGEIASWQVVNNALAAPAKVLGSAPNVYQIVAVADFTGDHQADILFRNLGTGEIAEWQVANNQLLSAQVVGSTANAYHVVGTGDFDGNGANDILFRHDNGQLVMWLLNSAGQLLTAPQAVGSVSNIYHVDGTGDLNGDGRSDIIFRDTSDNVVEWLMNGASAQAMQDVGRISQDFSIAAHHFDLI
jgi:hypothetical protein